jgi:predicted nucleic acid-binding protein
VSSSTFQRGPSWQARPISAPSKVAVIVLDTNVVFELMRPAPDRGVVGWVDERPVSDLLITSITAAELRAGAALLSAGRRRAQIVDQIEILIEETFAGAVLPFDADSGPFYAEIVATRRRVGRPIAALDAQIAAICRQHDASLATRNQRDFADTGIDLLDPWTARAQ